MVELQDSVENELADLIEILNQNNDSSQSSLRDLLTDVRHLSDRLGLNFTEALDGSYVVYLEEKDVKKAEQAVPATKGNSKKKCQKPKKQKK